MGPNLPPQAQNAAPDLDFLDDVPGGLTNFPPLTTVDLPSAPEAGTGLGIADGHLPGVMDFDFDSLR